MAERRSKPFESTETRTSRGVSSHSSRCPPKWTQVEAGAPFAYRPLAMTDLANVNPESRAETLMAAPDRVVNVREAFGVDSDMEVPGFSEADERVPDLDPTY